MLTATVSPGMTSIIDRAGEAVTGERTDGTPKGDPNGSGHGPTTLDRHDYGKEQGLVTISRSWPY